MKSSSTTRTRITGGPYRSRRRRRGGRPRRRPVGVDERRDPEARGEQGDAVDPPHLDLAAAATADEAGEREADPVLRGVDPLGRHPVLEQGRLQLVGHPGARSRRRRSRRCSRPAGSGPRRTAGRTRRPGRGRRRCRRGCRARWRRRRRRGSRAGRAGVSSVIVRSIRRSFAVAALAMSRAAIVGSSTRVLTARSRACRRSLSASTYRTTSSSSPIWMRPLMVCSWLANSWAWERSTWVVERNEPISRSRSARAVRSRIVVTVPRTRSPLTTRIVLMTRTRPRRMTTSSRDGRHVVVRVEVGSRSGVLPDEHLLQPALDPQVRHRRADRVLGQVEQPAGDLVDEGDPVLRVEGDDPLGDAAQHRLPVLGEPGDLARLHAAGLPLDPPGQQPRPAEPDEQGDAEVGEEVGRGALQALPRASATARRP